MHELLLHFESKLLHQLGMSRCTRSGNILDVADPKRCWCHFLLPGSAPDAKRNCNCGCSPVPFILATNVLDIDELTDDDVLRVQGAAIHRTWFPLLKDPLFFTSSVFLNSTERVAALAMVMGLCLLVYNLGQRALRQALSDPNRPLIISWVNQLLPYVTLGVSMFDVHSSGYGRSKSTDYESHRRTTLDSPVFALVGNIISLLIDLRNVGFN